MESGEAVLKPNALSIISFCAALGFQVSGYTNIPLAVALWALCAVLVLYAHPPRFLRSACEWSLWGQRRIAAPHSQEPQVDGVLRPPPGSIVIQIDGGAGLRTTLQGGKYDAIWEINATFIPTAPTHIAQILLNCEGEMIEPSGAPTLGLPHLIQHAETHPITFHIPERFAQRGHLKARLVVVAGAHRSESSEMQWWQRRD